MITLYESRGAGDRRGSLFSRLTRTTFAHKPAFESQPVPVSDKSAIAFSGGPTVPLICDGQAAVRDSWKIAGHLESACRDAPSLFGGPVMRGLSQPFDIRAGRTLMPAVLPVIVDDRCARVDPAGRDRFRLAMAGVQKKCRLARDAAAD